LKYRSQLLIVPTLLALFLAPVSKAQVTQPQPLVATQKVDQMLDRILARGEGHVGNVKTTTYVHPTQKELDEIRTMGVSAVPALSKAIDDPNPFRELLAAQLLKEIGGTEVVEPLTRGLSPKKWTLVRTQCLSSLTSAPPEEARPIIEKMQDDPDERVKKRAGDLLTAHYGAPPRN